MYSLMCLASNGCTVYEEEGVEDLSAELYLAFLALHDFFNKMRMISSLTQSSHPTSNNKDCTVAASCDASCDKGVVEAVAEDGQEERGGGEDP
jgi:hypothetical protein